jgi:hypothetical protein
MGNLGDRLFRAPGLLRGRVVDWINLPHFPWTFNLADASITCAAVLIAMLVGAEVDVSFRFFDPAWLSAELEHAGFTIESLTRRQPYPNTEVPTPRAYFQARAQ